jgi:flagellar hook assembly protein FlgD
LSNTEDVHISIFDLTGKKVVDLVNQKQQPGTYSISWNGTDASGVSLSSGIYTLYMQAGSKVSTHKMAINR